MIKVVKINLRQFNNGLSVVVIFLALYIFLWPVLPQLMWWIKYDAPLVSSPVASSLPAQAPPAENTLIIPGLDLRQPINEGNTLQAANRGTWRRPFTATPPDKGNMVIVGHRFTYQGASVFYHLDKLRAGDQILIYWEEKPYYYEVISTRTVPPTDTSVEGRHLEHLLTLYTCTPLWTAKDRLVVQAKPIREPIQ